MYNIVHSEKYGGCDILIEKNENGYLNYRALVTDEARILATGWKRTMKGAVRNGRKVVDQATRGLI